MFSCGCKFKVGKQLGTGNTTLIFALVGDQKHVLRIPKHVGPFLRPVDTRPENFDTEEFIDWFVEGVREIEGTRLPVVHIKESLSHEYIEVDRLESGMVSFGEFANRFDSFSERERKDMVKAMDRFLVKSADKTSIMDLHEGNLVYLPDRKGWIIADVSSGVEDFDSSKRITVRSKTLLNGLTRIWKFKKEVPSTLRSWNGKN